MGTGPVVYNVFLFIVFEIFAALKNGGYGDTNSDCRVNPSFECRNVILRHVKPRRMREVCGPRRPLGFGTFEWAEAGYNHAVGQPFGRSPRGERHALI